MSKYQSGDGLPILDYCLFTMMMIMIIMLMMRILVIILMLVIITLVFNYQSEYGWLISTFLLIYAHFLQHKKWKISSIPKIMMNACEYNLLSNNRRGAQILLFCVCFFSRIRFYNTYPGIALFLQAPLLAIVQLLGAN